MNSENLMWFSVLLLNIAFVLHVYGTSKRENTLEDQIISNAECIRKLRKDLRELEMHVYFVNQPNDPPKQP